MRHTIGGTWIMQLMILFILLFVGFIILTLNYSKTVRIKNEMVSMIEKYEGLNEQSIKLVNDFLLTSGYSGMGECNPNNDPGIYGSLDLSTSYLEEASRGTRYHYCVKKYKGSNISYYYQVTIFYKFNLPIFGNTGSYVVKGTTSNFQPKDAADYAQSVDGSYSNASPSPGTGVATYTVTFNLNGASGALPSQSVSAGSRATRPTDPVRSGYIFSGWQYNGRDYNFNSLVNSNITLTAKWTRGSITPSGTYYTVSFNLNGGTATKSIGHGFPTTTIPSQTVASGSKATQPIGPYKYNPNSIFMGWELNGVPYDFNTPVTSNITLTATWREANRVAVQIPSTSSCKGEHRLSDGRVYNFTNMYFYVDADYKVSLGSLRIYEGPNYGSNFSNNAYDWTSIIGIDKPITRWVTSSGEVWDVSMPLTDGLILNAFCD